MIKKGLRVFFETIQDFDQLDPKWSDLNRFLEY